jgi:hypothetical protein
MDDPVVREDPQTGDRIWFELTEFERNFFDQPLHILNNLLTAGKCVFQLIMIYINKYLNLIVFLT